jgi:Xaa-Pro aminopeptidase
MHPGRNERLAAIAGPLQQQGLSALVCVHNLNVLLLSGYWPVTGAALAIATAEPRVVLLVPEDARELAQAGWADDIHTYRQASLDALTEPGEALGAALGKLLPRLLDARPRLGHDGGVGHLPSSYVSQQVLGSALPALLQAAVPGATLAPADVLLMRLRSRPTAWERGQIRLACDIAAQAYRAGSAALRPGIAETEAALPFTAALTGAASAEQVQRSGGAFFCMSGPNAAEAYAAFQQSRQRPLRMGEPVLVHCNSYVGGYWTDITRTYVLGEPDARLHALQQAVFEARAAALAAIRPGARARDIDLAARGVLEAAGFGPAFRHATGHGVGFEAINHDAWPRLHPRSDDLLEEGMVFNVEPGLYFPGELGLRDCNMVAVTADGHELLTPFHLGLDDWRLSAGASTRP